MPETTRNDLLRALSSALEQAEGFSALQPDLYTLNLHLRYNGRKFTLLLRKSDIKIRNEYSKTKRDRLAAQLRKKYSDEYDKYLADGRALGLTGVQSHTYARTELRRAHTVEWKHMLSTANKAKRRHSSENAYEAFVQLKLRYNEEWLILHNYEKATLPKGVDKKKAYGPAKYKFIHTHHDEYKEILYKLSLDKVSKKEERVS